jgi:hypothetical protein
VQFLQLPRLLSQFRSIDHEKNISSCIAQVAALWGTFENCSVGGATKDPCTLILIWDTGALFGLTSFCSDFIDYVECNILVRDVTKVNKVIRIRTTIHKFMDINENLVFLPCVSYHLPQTDICLFSPQTYNQMHGGYSEVYGQSIKMKLRTSSIHIDIIQDQAYLPVVHDSFVSEKAKHGLAPFFGLACVRQVFLFWISLGRLNVPSYPLLAMQNQTVFPFSRVSVIQRMAI